MFVSALIVPLFCIWPPCFLLPYCVSFRIVFSVVIFVCHCSQCCLCPHWITCPHCSSVLDCCPQFCLYLYYVSVLIVVSVLSTGSFFIVVSILLFLRPQSCLCPLCWPIHTFVSILISYCFVSVLILFLTSLVLFLIVFSVIVVRHCSQCSFSPHWWICPHW